MIIDPSRMLQLSNSLYGLAALLTLFATFGVIYFGRVVSDLKDAQVKQYQKEADERISTADLKAAQAYQKASEANSKAEHERTERLKLEDRLKPRKISDTLRPALIEKLRSLNREQLALCRFCDSSVESLELARSISELLVEADWKSVFKESPFYGLLVTGVAIEHTPDPKSIEAANLLIHVLKDAGIDTEILLQEPYENATVFEPDPSNPYSYNVVVSVGQQAIHT